MADKEGPNESIELSIAKVFSVKLPPVVAETLFGPSPTKLKERALSASATEKILAGQPLHPDEQLAHDVFMAPLRKKAARLLETGQRAAEILAHEPKLLPGHVDGQPTPEPQAPIEAWNDRYREGASLDASPDVREMWARILAGEVTRPGSFSFKTLSVLKDVDTEAARDFVRLLAFKVEGYVPHIERLVGTYKEAGLGPAEFLRLEELGLISYSSRTVINKPAPAIFDCARYCFTLPVGVGQLGIHPLTRAGFELASVSDVKQEHFAILALAEWIGTRGDGLRFGIRSAPGGKINDTIPWSEVAFEVNEETGELRFV